MEENRTEDIIKNYEKKEKDYTKTAKNTEYLNKLNDINDNRMEQNRLKMHIEKLEREEETVSDFQVKEEYQRQIKESRNELETKATEMEKLENEKQEMLVAKRKNEKQLIEKITNELNSLQDQTRKDLMAEKKSLETQVAKKRLEIENKNFELSQFEYKYDEKGVPINGQDFRQLQEDRAKLNEEITKLESSINRCDEYKNKLISPIKTLPELPDDRVYIGIQKDKNINNEQPQTEEPKKEQSQEEIKQDNEKEEPKKVEENLKKDSELKEKQHSGKNVFETNDIIDNAKKELENESKDYSKIHLEPNQIIQENPIKDATRKNDKNVFETNNIIDNVRNEMGLGTKNDKGVRQPITPTAKKDEEKKSDNKITYIGIYEKEGKIFYQDAQGNKENISIAEVFENKKSQFKRLDIKNICKEIAGGRLKGALLGRKVNPEIVSVLQHDPEQLKDYITSIYQKKELPFELTHHLRGIGILDKIRMNRFARTEEKLGAKVIGKLFDKNRGIDGIKDNKMLSVAKEGLEKGMTAAKEKSIRAKDKAKDFVQKIPNKDNHIEEKANEAVKQSQEQTAKDVQEIMSQNDKEEEVK